MWSPLTKRGLSLPPSQTESHEHSLSWWQHPLFGWMKTFCLVLFLPLLVAHFFWSQRREPTNNNSIGSVFWIPNACTLKHHFCGHFIFHLSPCEFVQGQCTLGSSSCKPVFSPCPSPCGLCLPWELWGGLWGHESPCEAFEERMAFQAPRGDSGLCFSFTVGLSPQPSHLPTYIHVYFCPFFQTCPTHVCDFRKMPLDLPVWRISTDYGERC